MEWILNELPEENRIILVYDMIKGLNIGYYDAMSQEFYSLDNTRLRDVCAWLYVPSKPGSFKRIQDTVRQKNYVNTVKIQHGGTEDV